MQSEFRVSWEIDILADSPEEAAKQAHKIMLDSDSIATVFSVRPWVTALPELGEPVIVDTRKGKND